jgi:hypothetical protein
MQRTIQPKKKSVRIALEAYVIAWNTALREVVGNMDTILLLRNSHPAYRLSFAASCQEAGLITEHELKEFRIGPITRDLN